ncbi:MAG: superoxide dismutase family protein [Clostridiales bacterium]|nr:superoxide dismutase family protein [Clostridiales bacterium]
MFFHTYKNNDILERLGGRADAYARVFGSREYRTIRGTVEFYQMPDKVLVQAHFIGLPDQIQQSPSGKPCGGSILGFHIHAGGSCTGNETDPFADAGGHYDNTVTASGNMQGCPHPYHAGDLPPLFVNNGTAYMVVATNRFTVEEILGHTVIVHAHPDDFHSQPAGDSGSRIACGIIRG